MTRNRTDRAGRGRARRRRGRLVPVAAAAGAAGSAGAQPSATVPPVAESNTVTSDARAVPVHHVELSAPGAGGVVAEVMVAEGDTVTEGQPLLRLDDAQAKAALDEATAAAQAATVAIKAADGAATQADAQVTPPGPRVDEADAAVRSADATRDATPSGDAQAGRQRGGGPGAGGGPRRQGAARRAPARRRRWPRSAFGQARLDETRAHGDPGRGPGGARRPDAHVADRGHGRLARRRGRRRRCRPPRPVARIADTVRLAVRDDRPRRGRDRPARRGRRPRPSTWTRSRTSTSRPRSSRSRRSASRRRATSSTRVVLEPTGDVPDGLRWNMTASAQIEAAP